MTDVWTCWLLRGSHRLWRHSRVARSSNFRHCRLNVEVGREFVEDRRRSPPYPSSEPCRSASGCMRSVHIYFRSRWSSRAIRRAALTTNEVTRASHMHYDALPTRRVRVCKIGLHEKLFKLCPTLAFDKRQFVCLPRCESVTFGQWVLQVASMHISRRVRRHCSKRKMRTARRRVSDWQSHTVVNFDDAFWRTMHVAGFARTSDCSDNRCCRYEHVSLPRAGTLDRPPSVTNDTFTASPVRANAIWDRPTYHIPTINGAARL